MAIINLLIADSHDMVRSQLSARLRREPGFQVVGEARNSPQLKESALAMKPHVVLVDPKMRDGEGLLVIAELVPALPQTIFVVLTAVVDTHFQLELSKVGVRRMFNKGIATDRLIQEIHSLVSVGT